MGKTEFIIITTLEPENIGVENIQSSEELLPGIILYQTTELASDILFLKDNNMQIWKTAVRSAIDKNIKNFIFIGSGKDLSENPKSVYLIKDHVNMSGENPLIGPNDDKYGVRFPDMTDLYAKQFRDLLKDKIPETVIFIPKDLNNQTDLEKQVASANNLTVFSHDIVPGVIVAQHTGAKSLGLIITSNSVNLTAFFKRVENNETINNDT